MTDTQKKIGLSIVVIILLAIAGYSAFSATSGPKEEVVGTLPMAAGGGRDAEKGAVKPPAGEQPADPSGMPSSVLQNGK